MGTGDQMQRDIGRDLVAVHDKFPFTFVVAVGDNIYGSQDMITKFEEPYKALLDQKIEFYAALGNHDDQNERFYKPFNMGGKRYFTFKKNNVRFFALDSNYMDKEQLDWLEKELASSGSEWKIAFFHHPLYSTGNTHGPSVDLRAQLEPLFVKYDVSVVLAGHEHFYERLKPQQGIQYFISGAGGQLRKGDIIRKEPMAVGYDADRSYMLMEVIGKELYFQAINRTGVTVDKGTITQLEAHGQKEVVTSPPAAPKGVPSKSAPAAAPSTAPAAPAPATASPSQRD
jgi:predicted phosphodiesterase